MMATNDERERQQSTTAADDDVNDGGEQWQQQRTMTEAVAEDSIGQRVQRWRTTTAYKESFPSVNGRHRTDPDGFFITPL